MLQGLVIFFNVIIFINKYAKIARKFNTHTRTHFMYIQFVLVYFCFCFSNLCTATYFIAVMEGIICNLLSFSSNTNILCQSSVIFFYLFFLFNSFT